MLRVARASTNAPSSAAIMAITSSRAIVYDHDRNDNSRERLALAAELAAALEGRGIEVHFQPQADVRSRRIVGVEALVRWRRADGRLPRSSRTAGVAG